MSFELPEAGKPVTMRCVLEGLAAICDAITNSSVTVTPAEGWQDLFENAINNTITPLLDDMLESLQAICDKLDEGITVNAVQSGEWTVDVGDVSGEVGLSDEAIANLVSALEDAGPFSVTLDGETITVTLDQATLDALEDITVTVDTSAGPVEVTGSVTIDQSGGPLQVEVTNFPTTISIDNFQDLIDGLEGLTVSLGDEVITVSLDQATIDLLTADDDTDDDIRPAPIQCFCWTDGEGNLNKFTGYGKANEDGSFAGLEVVGGTPPPPGVEFECLDTKLLDIFLNGPCPVPGEGGGEDELCDFNVQFKSSGLQVLTTDKGDIPISLPNQNFSSTTGTSPELEAAQAEIQAFLDANGGGTVTLSYPSESILDISIEGTTCVFTSADDDSNPGPHEFTKTPSGGGGGGGGEPSGTLLWNCDAMETFTVNGTDVDVSTIGNGNAFLDLQDLGNAPFAAGVIPPGTTTGQADLIAAVEGVLGLPAGSVGLEVVFTPNPNFNIAMNFTGLPAGTVIGGTTPCASDPAWTAARAVRKG